MRPSLLWIVTLAALTPLAARAADDAPAVLTLADALRLADERNPGITASREGVAASEASLGARRGQWLPKLSAGWSGSAQQSLARPIDIGGGVIQSTAQRSTTRSLALSLTQTFYRSGLREQIASAGTQLEASRYSLEDMRRQLMLQVATTYNSILANLELARVAQDSVAAAEQNLDMVRARIEAGNAAAVDSLRVESELADARLEAVRATNATWQSIAELRALLALEGLRQPVLQGDLSAPPPPPALGAALEQALAERPDIAAQKASVRLATLAVDQARISAGLSFSAQGQWDYGNYTGTTGDSWALQAAVTYPLFDRTVRSNLRAAEADLRAAEARLQSLRNSVSREVESAWYALDNAIQRVPAAQASVDAARANLDATRERYALGAAMVVEVTDAELAWTQARVRLIQAQYDRSTQYYSLMVAMGRSLLTEVPGAGVEASGTAPEIAPADGS